MTRFCENCANHICTLLGRCERKHAEMVSALARDKIAEMRMRDASPPISRVDEYPTEEME